MSELRYDPIQKQWRVIAPERGRRAVHSSISPVDSGFCPFCPGSEESTGNPIRVVLDNDTKHSGAKEWKVRVIPNKFPALQVEGDLDGSAEGIYDRLNGIGAHEIIIETPKHNQQLPDLPLSHLTQVLSVYQERLSDLLRDTRLRYILLFKNYGTQAGATVTHPHSQLIATPFTPPNIAVELKSARDHYFHKERCIFCDVMAQEIADGSRIVSMNEHFLAFCPYASRFPFEVHLLPRRHIHDFRRTGPELLKNLALMLKEVLLRLRIGLDDPPYNMLLHTSPNTRSGALREGYWRSIEHDFHWHFEIFPYSPQLAGFEMGTGVHINTTAPETAAAFLREINLGNIE